MQDFLHGDCFNRKIKSDNIKTTKIILKKSGATSLIPTFETVMNYFIKFRFNLQIEWI